MAFMARHSERFWWHLVRGTFGDRAQLLKDAVGNGHLIGYLEVNQIYARYQHEGVDFFHPDGGEWNYLRGPFFAEIMRYMQMLADGTITEEGSDILGAMIDVMEDLSLQVFDHAPWEFADLRASGHPSVESEGDVVYDRAPMIGRLEEDELREKARLSELFWPDRYRGR